jgi:ATP-binding cassette subfamily C protein CydD
MLINRELINQAVRHRLMFFICILSGFFVGLAVIAQASLISRIINRVYLLHQPLTSLTGLFLILVPVICLRAGWVWLQNFSASRLAMDVKHSLRKTLFSHLLRLGPAFLNGEKSGEINSAAVEGIEGVDAYFSQYLPQLILAALVPLSIAAFILPRDLLSMIILLVTAPLVPIFMVLIGNLAEKVTRRQWETLNRLSAAYLDTIQGLTTLKLLNQSLRRAKELDRINEDYRLTTLKVLRITFLSAFVLEFISTISTAIVAVEIGLRLLYGQIGFESALFILILTPEFYLPLRTLGLRFHAGMNGSAAARRIFELLSIQPEVDFNLAAGKDSSGTIFPVAFSGVSYQYTGTENPILDGVSFTIHQGEHIALVGSSGSGKSTIVQLLLQFRFAQGGQITAGGTSLMEIPRGEWLRHTAWVSQTPYLFNTSIRENICLGKPDASGEEIDRAARQAGLAEFVDRLPGGYDTPVGEGGVKLSGGQAQRLAIARAYLKDAPLLILDEPTAFLDPETEEELQTICADLMKNRTVFMIAHRLATIHRADRILVLENGRIVEDGAFSTLSTAGGVFARRIRQNEGAYGS